MEPSAYTEMASLEERHWWFVARRHILARVLKTLDLPANAKILELGCGTGGNLAMLKAHGELCAGEYDAEARRMAAAKGIAKRIEPCELPQSFPFGEEKFDLIVMLDVLEHIEDDLGSLKAVRAHLGDRGWLLLTVPAFQFLWSAHDVKLHHKRRYRLEKLAALAREAGLTPVHLSYFNFWLFPAVAAARLGKSLVFGERADAPSDMKMPPSILNGFLEWLFASERFLVGRCRLPFGVSCIMSARAAAA